MKSIIFSIILIFNFNLNSEVSETNFKIKKASQQYSLQNYQEALNFLLTLQKSDDENLKIQLNIAHCYFQLKKYTQAYRLYKKLLISSSDKKLNSTIQLQLALIHAITAKEMLEKKYEQNKIAYQYQKAIYYLKFSLINNYENNIARKNLELLSKQGLAFKAIETENQKEKPLTNKKEEKKEEKNKQNIENEVEKGKKEALKQKENNQLENTENKPKQNSKNGTSPGIENNQDGNVAGGTQQNKGIVDENGDINTRLEFEKEQLTKSKPSMNKNKLKRMNLSEEAALKILNEMKSEELQYLQQQYHKPFPYHNSKNKSIH